MLGGGREKKNPRNDLSIVFGTIPFHPTPHSAYKIHDILYAFVQYIFIYFIYLLFLYRLQYYIGKTRAHDLLPSPP